MRELAALIAVVLLVYLFQCLSWAPVRAHVFSLETSGENGKKKRGFLWSALKLTGYWANPLPPLQPLLLVDWPQVQPEPEVVRVAQPDGEFMTVAWERFEVKRSGAKLLCNNVVVFEGGADQLKQYQGFLEKVKRAKGKDRKKVLEAWLRKATDTASIQDRFKLFCRKSRWLETFANLQFFLLFMLVPVTFLRFGSRVLWPMLAAVVVNSMVIAWQSLRLHRLFFPSDGDGRFKSVFSTVLSPINAIRAMDALARDLMAGFHPVAVAAVVCSQQELEIFAGEQLRANQFGASGTGWYTQQLQLALTNMLLKKGVAATQLLSAPQRDESCVQYCPRCRAQYTKMRESCADCGYTELMEFGEPTQKPARH
jgi:hypothetical protein